MPALTLNAETMKASLSPELAENWYAVLEYADGRFIAADTITDLVAELIPGYASIDASTEDGALAALDARYDFAVHNVTVRQAIQLFALTAAGEFDADAESEGTLTALFAAKDAQPFTGAAWEHHAPLVLIGTDYAPYADRAAPEGNIEWVNPATELTLLQTLALLGDFQLHIRD